MAEGGGISQSDAYNAEMTTTSGASFKDLSVTGMTGGSAQNVIAAGVIHGNVTVGFDGDLKRLEDQTLDEISAWTKEMINVSAVDKVVRKLEEGLNWVTITGNAGEGKTTLGFLVLKKLSQKGHTVFKTDTPEEYTKVTKMKKDSIIMLNDVFGAFTFDSAAFIKWHLTIYRALESFEKATAAGRQKHRHKSKTENHQTRVLFISRRNVLEGARDYLLRYQDLIFDESSVTDLTKTGDLKERLQILNCYLGKSNLFVPEHVKLRVVAGKTPHGFPHCCKIYAQIAVKGEDINIENFFASPLQFLDQTTKVLMKNPSCTALFKTLIVNNGLIPVDMYHITDESLREKIQTAAFELIGSYLKRALGDLTFSHPSIYESVLSVISEKDQVFVVDNASLSVLKQKIHIKKSDQESLSGSINLDPLPNVLHSLEKRFRPRILMKDFSIFSSLQLCRNVEFCQALVSSTTRQSRRSKISRWVFKKTKKIYIDERDATNRTMLHTALENTNYTALSILLEHGADVNKPWTVVKASRMGQILWVRGLTRLQQQIRVINAFRILHDTSVKRQPVVKERASSIQSLVNYLDVRETDDETQNVCHENSSQEKTGFGTSESFSYDDEKVEDGEKTTRSRRIRKEEEEDEKKNEEVGKKEEDKWIGDDGGDDVYGYGDMEDVTALHYICSHRYPDVRVMRLLIRHGAAVNKPDGNGQTALHYLCCKKKPDVNAVELLLKHRADVNKTARSGETPFHCMCRRNSSNRACFELLLKHGADVHKRDVYDRLPAYYLKDAKMTKFVGQIARNVLSSE